MIRLWLGFTFIFLLSSCLQEPPVVNPVISSDSNETKDPTEVTDIGSPTNYLQESATTTISTLNLKYDFNDSFMIRGNEVHNYLTANLNSSITICVVASFVASSPHNVMAFVAKVKNYYNYAQNVNEFYLQVEPNNEAQNLANCSNIDITNKISSLYSSTLIAYKLEALCPSCTSNQLSTSLKLLVNNGIEILDIDTSALKINMTYSDNSSTGQTTGSSCTEDTSCITSGYNCCLAGQCVTHGATRANVNTSDTNYIAALNQVNANAQSVTNYPNFFYICPNMIDNSSNSGSGSNSSGQGTSASEEELLNLKELYNCINPTLDEYSICSTKYENASVTLADNSGSYTFNGSDSDITFNSINANLNLNNIYKVTWGEVVLYEENEVNLDPLIGSFSLQNDDLTSSQDLNIIGTIPSGAINDSLKIQYKVDGTCEALTNSIAKCSKTYIQGQTTTPARTTDHASGQVFSIPSYVDLAYNISVKVNGTNIAPSSSTWNISSNDVVFVPAYTIFNNQTVTIDYFVTTNVSALTMAKQLAQNQVNTICSCTGGVNCNLEPVYQIQDDTSSPIINFSCVTPSQSNNNGPLQETFYISSKTVAHKFYDATGVYYKYDNLAGKQQECARSSLDETGCTSFSYDNNNKNKPNNESTYIGFNEITGTFNQGVSPAIPAYELDVVKGTSYDIFTDEGLFSTCINCGDDYHNSLAAIFPNSFVHKGGGYLPDMVESRRLSSTSRFNADDKKFGRACFVPPTMIPWSHVPNNDVTTQRRNRLQTQHFMFANGYNKDWYGFDYGSVIGSFDGVTWFSIGNQRNITAKSNKLYIAINAYYGDETLNNSFRITVSEISSIIGSGSSVTHDTLSDGAQCQLAHFCETDNDCIAKLGHEYACENVSQMRTPWPKFDDNANEISGKLDLSLASLVGGINSNPKRCVYRSRGALCSPSASTVTQATSYLDSTNKAYHMCSANTFCSSFASANFNNKISRYASSPINQNVQSFIPTLSDTIGLKARFMGRPYKFFGDEVPQTTALANLTNNKAQGMCVPGKLKTTSITIDNLNSFDSISNNADTNFNLGVTNIGFMQDSTYYAACTTTDSAGNFTYKNQSTDINLADPNHHIFSTTQNMSTNALDLNALFSSNIFNDGQSPKISIGYEKNRCLRAPGASCYTDMECANNTWIAQKFQAASNLNTELNQAEIDFWKEELICGTKENKYPSGSIYPNINYKASEQRCCRETEKTISFYSKQASDNSFDIANAPGADIALNNITRYSRIHTIYDLLTNNPSEYPSLAVEDYNANSTALLTISSNIGDNAYTKQYKTLHAHNSKVCCSENWIREFATGGHTHSSTTGQVYNGGTGGTLPFKFLNWLPKTSGVTTIFACDNLNVDTPDCGMRYISEGSSFEKKWLDFFSRLELSGIPQIYIPSPENSAYENDMVNIAQDPIAGDNPFRSTTLGTTPLFLTGAANDPDITDGTTDYYSAASNNKFNMNKPKIFSENKFACCIQAGPVDDSVTNNQCCSGLVAGAASERRCCLPDFTDLSVYTNRYVSSEGAKLNGLEITDVDPQTGYIKKEIVMQMAQTMCCSGQASYGVAISELFTPLGTSGQIDQDKTKRRFVQGYSSDAATETGDILSKFQAGVKWNNHVYCVPDGFND
ncbi:MAG: hypothetical protein N4A33_00810 [Bacteriovoracaceae bacterium]|jgi:hypothetical protein|nr:hypothetical protein [Bacteriovoracaceae bacterium]